MNYDPKTAEPKWRQSWSDQQLYKTQISDKPKKYILDMFPYPSGEGLHVGHFKLYVASDIVSRYYRTKGFEVLHPMGWDAFGLPAENYAIKTGIHPRVTTQKNINKIKDQMELVGFSYDWSREFATSDPDYYKWTQWIFLQLFKAGLAYEDTVPINWCPVDKTGLANEEVVNGHCERCGAKVEQKLIRQWLLRITAYAEELLDGLEDLDWPESIKEMQRNWIGRSQGAMVEFKVEQSDQIITTFTTRVDTLYGVTAIVLAPEYKDLENIVTTDKKEEINKYIDKVIEQQDFERTEANRAKTGVFTGSYAIHPLTGQKLPIWVADYVLGNYGTGAVMLVAAHDNRDRQFAETYQLDIVPVIDDQTGLTVNSDRFDGLDSTQAIASILGALEAVKSGRAAVQYKLRDWVFSRQRYWGEPIPVVHCADCGIVAVPEDQLPLLLPEVDQYLPSGTGESPLATIPDWVNTTCPTCGGPAQRETNTMPQWAGSCWYYLRFCDPKNQDRLISTQNDQYWLPVDWYLGGAEHAVLHLLYARFWHKFLHNQGQIATSEPFQKLSSIGLVLSSDGRKMSKSKGNVISPDQIVEEYSADTLRVYEMFMGPFESTIAWDPKSINGVHRFLTKVWDKMVNEISIETENQVVTNQLADLADFVAGQIEALKLNTAIAAMMKWLNGVASEELTQIQKEQFAIILSSFAPFMAEEIWHQWGHQDSVHQQSWPVIAHPADLTQKKLALAVQINGKFRGTIEVSPEASQDQAVELATKQPGLDKYLANATVLKVIYIPGKVLNIMVQ